MSISRHAHLLILGLAAGSIPLFLVLSLHGQPVPQSAQSLVREPQQVADALDKIIQPRFQDVTLGQFGLTRLIPAVPGHPSVGFFGAFPTYSPRETALLASADAVHRPYVIAFLHCAHVPGALAPKTAQALPQVIPPAAPIKMASNIPSSLTTIIVKGSSSDPQHSYSEKTQSLLRQTAFHALPAALKGRNVETQTSGWTVFLRPVSAFQNSCLTCHAGAKRGDTLGVMVYAVSSTVVKNE